MKIKYLLTLLACGSAAHGAVIFTEDFSGTTVLPNDTQETLGFFNGNALSDGIVVSSNATIANGELGINSTSGFRGIGLVLTPETLGSSPGTFQLQFDIVSFDRGENFGTVGTGFAEVNIFSGNGFQAADDANAVLLNSQTGELAALGTAVSTELASQNFTTAGDNITITFEYDGSGAIAIFFGANTSSFPFPSVVFDNIQVSTIPEPSSVFYISITSLFVLLRRKRSEVYVDESTPVLAGVECC